MGSFHDAGWRQGSLVRATLPLDGVVALSSNAPGTPSAPARDLLPLTRRVMLTVAQGLVAKSGARIIMPRSLGIVRQQGEHDHWLVVTQECDLARLDANDPLPTVELRPVYDEDPPATLGLRSYKLLLDSPYYLEAQSSRVMISPAALTILAARGVEIGLVSAERQLALKAWLGLRYDRPAVPTELGALATALAEQVKQKKHRSLARKIYDVLTQFDLGPPIRFSLYAIIVDEADRREVETWLSGIARSIPTSIGVGDDLQAYTKTETSLALIEASYSVDASDVTWNKPAPDGSYPDGVY